MNIPFLKKYQPKYYSDFIIDQEYINILKTMHKLNYINFLLVGNAGCGKTSLLLATIREYYQKEEIPKENILSINNLKEQGIQYYRNELKTFCKTPSLIRNKKKFIIIDDIDQINEQSQQVFRNCIDKYSHNVHFLASCSNTQKVIDSIQSRCTIIKIKPIKKKFLKLILQNIVKKENILINSNVEDFLIKISNNSIRMLINYLEKFKLLNKEINKTNISEICSNISFYEFENYTKLWYLKKDISSSTKILLNIYKKGYSVIDILDSYFNYIKVNEFISENEKYKIIKVLSKYISLFYTLHENNIELFFLTNDLINLKNI